MSIAVAAAACGDTPSPTAVRPVPSPTPIPVIVPSPSPSPVVALLAPRLVLPLEDTTIQQNDPDARCEYDRIMGYGFVINFEWAAAPGTSGVTSWRIELKNRDAPGSAVLTTVAAGSTRYVDRACNTYVTPGFEQGWEWHVQAVGPNNTAGPWSDTRTLQFTNCRLGFGRTCGG